MTYKIFLSHNHNDKPVVEAVALKLASIFGHDQVFYDSWSINPGDGIIDKINQGLSSPEFVFFFVSSSSLSSGMVALEWQNALYAATSGKLKIIPIKVDDSYMPAVLMQTLYIDMHTIGLDAAVSQIVSVTQGNVSFTPRYRAFSNLSCYTTIISDGSLDITIEASHLMEPNPSFVMIVTNLENEVDYSIVNASGCFKGYNKDIYMI